MRNLINFIIRYNFFFLFITLFSLSLVLVVRTHQHQRTVFFHSANLVSGYVYSQIDQMTSYINLKTVNEQLSNENTRLLNNLNSSFVIKDHDQFLLNDTLYLRRFSYLNARVINNSVLKMSNYLTLDKGLNDGVDRDMGVVTLDGVVGIVKDVSRNFSTVISLLHKDTQLSVRLVSNDHIGTLIWEGGYYRRATMTYIPSHVQLFSGDSVVTSGLSQIFPEGIFIGTISDFSVRKGETFYSAVVELALDYNRLRHVYVVNDLMKEELEILEETNF